MVKPTLEDHLEDQIIPVLDFLKNCDPAYYNNFMAFPSTRDITILAYGKDPLKLLLELQEQGHKEPFITYVTDPKEHMPNTNRMTRAYAKRQEQKKY